VLASPRRVGALRFIAYELLIAHGHAAHRVGGGQHPQGLLERFEIFDREQNDGQPPTVTVTRLRWLQMSRTSSASRDAASGTDIVDATAASVRIAGSGRYF
jgi:hypothetical protein